MYIFCSSFFGFFIYNCTLHYSQRLYNIENREQNVEKSIGGLEIMKILVELTCRMIFIDGALGTKRSSGDCAKSGREDQEF